MKTKFTHDIDPDKIELFGQMAKGLKTFKYELVETMILAFNAFPEDLQRRLLSESPEIREPALAALREIAVRSQPRKATAGSVARHRA